MSVPFTFRQSQVIILVNHTF